MKKEEIKVIRPETLGWLEYKLNPQEMDYVWRCIKNKKESYNDQLAGQLSYSNALVDRSDWFYMNTLKSLIIEYEKQWRNLGESLPTNQQHPYHLTKWWVNYQKQNEFNPLHHHSGIYSFVIWMKIPISWEEQNKKDIARKSNSPSIALFQFAYQNILGELAFHRYESSPEDEGIMLFFPSQLNHLVYPFYDCDEDRISVSGNIVLNTTKLP